MPLLNPSKRQRIGRRGASHARHGTDAGGHLTHVGRELGDVGESIVGRSAIAASARWSD